MLARSSALSVSVVLSAVLLVAFLAPSAVYGFTAAVGLLLGLTLAAALVASALDFYLRGGLARGRRG